MTRTSLLALVLVIVPGCLRGGGFGGVRLGGGGFGFHGGGFLAGSSLGGWKGTVHADDQPEIDAAAERKRQRENAEVRATGERLERELLASRPARLDRASAAAGIERVRAQVAACRAESEPRGRVAVAVTVDPDGEVVSTLVNDADGVTGACVASVLQRATFARTRHGGAFHFTLDL